MAVFFSGFFLSLSLCLDLGIANIAIIRAGILQGFRPSFRVGFGSCIGDLVYAALAMIGISLLLENLYVRWFLWIGGTSILIYFTVTMFRDALRPKEMDLNSREEATVRSPRSDFLLGVGLALSSPSAILWFATVGGSVIASLDIPSKMAFLLFFIGFFMAGFLWSIFLAIVSSRGGKWMGPRLIRYFSFLSALVFLFFAIKVFVDGYRTLF